MEATTVLLLLVGLIFLIGFLAGARFEELNLRVRERRLAAERRHTRGEAHGEGHDDSSPPLEASPPKNADQKNGR